MTENRLRIDAEKHLDQWIKDADLRQGNTPNSAAKLLDAFLEYLHCRGVTVPVSKHLFGRLMTARFYKNQNRSNYKMAYYLCKDYVGT